MRDLEGKTDRELLTMTLAGLDDADYAAHTSMLDCWAEELDSLDNLERAEGNAVQSIATRMRVLAEIMRRDREATSGEEAGNV